MSFYLICDVDTEFDYLRYGLTKPTKNNLGLVKGTKNLLEFFSSRGMKTTLHIQEQKEKNKSVFEKYPEIYKLADEHKAEVSLHSHLAKPDYKSRKEELVAGTERLRNQGYKVSNFRAGWYFQNKNGYKALEELKFKGDFSPLKDSVVANIDWFDIPDSPYYPNPKNLKKTGKGKVLMFPIQSNKLGIGIHENKDVEFEMSKKGTEFLHEKSKKQDVFLFYSDHSWKPINAKTGKTRKWVINRRNKYFDFLKDLNPKSITCEEAVKIWGDNKPYTLKLPDITGSYRPLYHPLKNRTINKHLLANVYKLKYLTTKKP